MKNNNAGCLGQIIGLFILLWLLCLIIDYWYIIAIIIGVIVLFWWLGSRRTKAYQKRYPTSNSANIKTATKPQNIVQPYIPQPIKYDDIKEYAKNEPPIMKMEGNKYINSWTGHKCASPKALAITKDKLDNFGHQKLTYEHLVKLSVDDPEKAVKQYLLTISSPYYDGGMLAYQRGDLDKAELWFSQILDSLPVQASQRLAIIFKRSKRYKDMVDVYRKALDYCQNNYITSTTTQYNDLVTRKNKAGNLLINHLNDDQSEGIKQFPTLIDFKFIKELQHTSKPD